MTITNKILLQRGIPKKSLLTSGKKKNKISVRAGANADNLQFSKKLLLISTYDPSRSSASGLSLYDGNLHLSETSDQVIVSGQFWLAPPGYNLNGFYSSKGGTLDMAGGDDSINIYKNDCCTGFLRGLELEGSILMGQGDDRLYSDAGINTNIQVWGTLDMGLGNDTIETLADDRRISGFSVGSGGKVFLGEGDDSIICSRPTNAYTAARHIEISGFLDAGPGNDVIIGDQLQVFIGGDLLMGSGDDLISAELYGSNNSTIDFGEGVDTLRLKPSEYSVSDYGNGVYRLYSSLGATYLISGLEWVGPQGSADVIPFQVGSFVIS